MLSQERNADTFAILNGVLTRSVVPVISDPALAPCAPDDGISALKQCESEKSMFTQAAFWGQ